MHFIVLFIFDVTLLFKQYTNTTNTHDILKKSISSVQTTSLDYARKALLYVCVRYLIYMCTVVSIGISLIVGKVNILMINTNNIAFQ